MLAWTASPAAAFLVVQLPAASKLLVFAAYALCAIGQTGSNIAATHAIFWLAPRKEAFAYLTAYTSVVGFGMITGPLLAGLLSDAIGGFSLTLSGQTLGRYEICLLVCLVGFAILNVTNLFSPRGHYPRRA